MAIQAKSGKSGASGGKTKSSKTFRLQKEKTSFKAKEILANDDDDELTIEVLQKAAAEAFSKAASTTMKVMGYNVISKDGWIVKKYADGRIEKISKLENHHNKPFILD
jgi:hypothetical protein